MRAASAGRLPVLPYCCCCCCPAVLACWRRGHLRQPAALHSPPAGHMATYITVVITVAGSRRAYVTPWLCLRRVQGGRQPVEERTARNPAGLKKADAGCTCFCGLEHVLGKYRSCVHCSCNLPLQARLNNAAVLHSTASCGCCVGCVGMPHTPLVAVHSDPCSRQLYTAAPMIIII